MANLLLNVAARGAGFSAGAFGSAASAAFISLTDNCLACLQRCLVCPHPTECGCIGAIGYCLGCQDHRKFNMVVEVHELERLQKGAPVYIEASVGRLQLLTRDIPVTKSTELVEERLLLKVRQADNIVILRLMKKGILKTEAIAEYRFRVKQDIIDKKFPKKQWTVMNAVKGANNVKILLSFHYIDPSLPAAQSPLLQQALLLAQQEAEARKEPLNLDLAGMGEKERLVFFSKVLEGPLQRMASSGSAWTDLYFKALETAKDRWEWCCWTSRQACYTDAHIVASYPFLAISLVLPDKTDPNVFYVRYHEKYKTHDLFFKRVDRSRDLWSDGLFEFIDKLRAYLDLCATAGDAVPRMKVNDKKHKRKKQQPSVSASASGTASSWGANEPRRGNTRCLVSPRVNAIRDPRRPSSASAILSNLMYTTETNDGSSDEQEETLSSSTLS